MKVHAPTRYSKIKDNKMNSLIINTANEELYIALKLRSKIFSKSVNSSLKHNELMLTKIDEILKEANITLKDINELGVIIGPGSFTGIRVGIATVKAFRDALNIKARGINNLKLLYMLATAKDKDCQVVAINGSRDSYFVARKLFDKLYIYERNLTLSELKTIAQDKPIGMYKLDENLNSFKVEIKPKELFRCLNDSTDELLIPVYYQLSQAENEKLKHANIEVCDINESELEIVSKIESDSLNVNVIGLNEFKHLYKNENYKMLSLKVNGEIVGFVLVEFSDEVNIVTIAVKKEYRNLGLATKLIEQVKIIAKEKGLNKLSLEVSVNNPTAYLLYEKLGFKVRRERKNYYEDGSNCLEMVLENF